MIQGGFLMRSKPSGEPASKKAKKPGALRQYGSLYLMAAPGLLFFLVLCYIPMLFLIVAFQNYQVGKGVFGSEFVGLQNFVGLFTDRMFPMVLKNTIGLNLMKIVLTFPMPIILALCFNELRPTPMKKLCQTAVYLPHFFSWVIVASMLSSLLNVNTGLVNNLITALGGSPVAFLDSKSFYKLLLTITEIWKEAGWSSIIYIAALTAINTELYEAASIDGAGKWRHIWHISLPGIRSTIIIMLILSFGGIISGSFEQVFMTKNSAVYEVAEIIPTYVYTKGITNMDISYGATVGLFQSVIGFVLVVSTNWLSKRFGGEGLW